MNIYSNDEAAQIEMRKKIIFQNRYDELASRTDLMFCAVLIFQWLLAVVFAVTISPKVWSGTSSALHLHVFAAVFLGGLLSLAPCILVMRKKGALVNRIVIASSQMLFSVLLIHLTGGRIETHFHVFGSLAFLAFYRDVRPVLVATAITTIDHVLRGALWPESVYGVLYASPWRAIEHASWVAFEDVVLLTSIFFSRFELNEISVSQAKLEFTLSSVEKTVEVRTNQLRASQRETEVQQINLIAASKLSSLGEMAGGLAHEINNPIAIIRAKASQIRRLIESDRATKEQSIEFLGKIEETTLRVTKIIDGLRTFARDGRLDQFEPTLISKIVTDSVSLCQERFKTKGVELRWNIATDIQVECKATQVEQILVNLVGNAFDAVSESRNSWVRVDAVVKSEWVEFSVTDSGNGIPKDVVEKMMQPFFTTKPVGKGTGLGLSISHGIAKDHGGELVYNSDCPNTQFLLRFPIRRPATLDQKAS